MLRTSTFIASLLITSAGYAQCMVGNMTAPQDDDPNQRIGQSFRATCQGIIEYVELFCEESGTNVGGTLEIRSGSTVLGAPLYSQEYEATSVANGEALRIVLSEPVVIANMQQMTFELDMSLRIPFSGGNPYSGGRLFYGGTNSSTYAGSDTKFNVSILSNCDHTTASITASACQEYTAPSGVVWTETGEYMDTIPNMAGCDSLITVDLTVTPVDTSITQMSNVLSAGAADATYQWVDCLDGFAEIPEETGQTFEVDANGSYAVVVTQNMCSDTSACVQVLSTSLLDHSQDVYNVYPNPAQDRIILLGDEIHSVQFISTDGRVVATRAVSGTRTADVSGLAPGTYVIQVVDADGALSRGRFVKN